MIIDLVWICVFILSCALLWLFWRPIRFWVIFHAALVMTLIERWANYPNMPLCRKLRGQKNLWTDARKHFGFGNRR